MSNSNHIFYRYFAVDDYLMTARNVAMYENGIDYDLTPDNAEDYIGQYPIGGWYYFATEQEAHAFFDDIRVPIKEDVQSFESESAE